MINSVKMVAMLHFTLEGFQGFQMILKKNHHESVNKVADLTIKTCLTSVYMIIECHNGKVAHAL